MSPGTVTSRGGRGRPGLPAGVPVAVGTVDALAEALSVGVREPGDLMVMYGSTTFFILVTDAPVEAGSAVADGRRGARASGPSRPGSPPAARRWPGSATQFAADLVAAERGGGPTPSRRSRRRRPRPTATAARTSSSSPTSPASGRPINDPLARRVVAGAVARHSAAGRPVPRAAPGDRLRDPRQPRGDAGARRADPPGRSRSAAGPRIRLLLQLVSDATGIEQAIPASTIGAARGDALLAGLTAGVLDRADLSGWVEVADTVRPDPTTRDAHDRRYAAFRGLYAGDALDRP